AELRAPTRAASRRDRRGAPARARGARRRSFVPPGWRLGPSYIWWLAPGSGSRTGARATLSPSDDEGAAREADDHRLTIEGIRVALAEQPDIEIVGEATSGSEVLPLGGHTS